MKPDIDPNLRLSEIISLYPETRKVFVSNGLGALISEEGMRVLAPFLTLGTRLWRQTHEERQVNGNA